MTPGSVFFTFSTAFKKHIFANNWVNEEDWQHICHFKKFSIIHKKLMVREDHSNKDNILPFSAHNTNFKGWKAVNQPHLPNHT